MRYFIDTEFNGFGGDLISLALVPEKPTAPDFYAVLPCENPEPWVAENVMPILHDCPVEPDFYSPREGIARGLQRYFRSIGETSPHIVADWPDDIAYFCKALITGPGEMIALNGLVFEVARVDAYPTTVRGAVQHNAWWDAQALRALMFTTA